MNCIRLGLLGVSLTAVAVMPLPVVAQDTTSREIVQPLPSPEVRDLNEALRALARRPRDLEALLAAGNASLRVDDLDAAIGFFGRAEEVAPNNPRVSMGKAAVFLRSGRAIEALQLFAEAEAAGASARDVASDRGLAYDLVGDQMRAQAHYREALRTDPDNSTTMRRLALSQAITGQALAFEETLKPLVEKREFAAFRTLSFGLAILGEQERAEAITDTVMPRDLADSIKPYLAYMPRLTKAQQAAAANLGIFPRAADIGRDDPRIEQFAAGGSPSIEGAGAELAREAGTRLEPAGQPLGQTDEKPTVIAADPGAAAGGESQLDAVRLAQASTSADTDRRELASGAVAGPGFDLSRTASAEPVRVTRPGAGDQRPAASFADAFAELGADNVEAVAPAGGAVDIATIEIPREIEESEKAKGSEHPSRVWIQVATGKDRTALGFDWRRIARKAPELLGEFEPHVVVWGQSNRLLAGPVKDRAEARRLVNKLSDAGLDTFSYVSPEGTEIQPLK